jgi:hypothetical protein
MRKHRIHEEHKSENLYHWYGKPEVEPNDSSILAGAIVGIFITAVLFALVGLY